MLKLKGITKNYKAGGTTVAALRGIDLEFRESEFVCVLGPSGCGKTTLLNIVGGLDKYTRGDLVINGTSTKNYKDNDWDTYRNHSVGFVFQSYNLIPHQTVLSNVELALTLSGVSKAERTERAKKVIEQVGLSDQLHKKPNHLSGGQMQRVSIARALVNNPDILLADEPTGALDSETSVSIMELLKEIAKDKLIIMVTHNPDLANKYSTRLIHLLDGVVTSDSNPATGLDESETGTKQKKPSMSFVTALALSLNNLMTKKTRTFLTAFAGSIGIIGIALILSLSNGLQNYIDRVEKDTLSSYPIMIENEAIDLTGLIQSFTGERSYEHALDKVYTNSIMNRFFNAAVATVESNDLAAFKQDLDSNPEVIDPLVTSISYRYGVDIGLYYEDDAGSIYQVNPPTLFQELGMGPQASSGEDGMFSSSIMSSGNELWQELVGKQDFWQTQYELLDGKWPENYNEVVLIVDKRNEISDVLLYSLGLRGPNDIKQLKSNIAAGIETEEENTSFDYSEIIGLSYALVLPTDYYVKEGTAWLDKSDDVIHMRKLYDAAEMITIVGILRPSEDAVSSSVSGVAAYTADLPVHLINKINESEIAKEQLNSPETDIFTGLHFESSDEPIFSSIGDVTLYIASLPEDAQLQMQESVSEMREYGMPDEQIVALLNESMKQNSGSSFEQNLRTLGIADLDKPTGIYIYASSFENKELISEYIENYNNNVSDEFKIKYTDYIGLLMSSVTTVINAISYVLIAFVSISLVVSSIMIGIITYISVLERTKEIGILRSIGASKRDVSRVFNAETLIIGFTAGAFGIIVTLLLCIPANAIIYKLTDINNIARLPLAGAVVLILISMVLSFIAGLVPSRMAANKNPVAALRTE